MFQGAELGRKLSKADFDRELPELRTMVAEGQRALMEAKQSVLIIIEGLDGTGRGDLLNRLYGWIDPRGIETYTFWQPFEEETARPEFWRYWRALPKKGNIAIHLGGWYKDIITGAVRGTLSHAEMQHKLEQRYEMERMLALEGVIILKFWLHLSEDEQKKRITKKATRYFERCGRVRQKEFSKMRQKAIHVAEQVMRNTDSSVAPWYMIEANCPRYRDMTIGRSIARAMQNSVSMHDMWVKDSSTVFDQAGGGSPALPDAESARITVLDRVDLSKKLIKSEYTEKFNACKKRLSELSWQAWHEKITTIVAFEGWDAAGKGGAIRRLTAGMDARLYRAVQYAAPTTEEKGYPYLWRFWREIPRQGNVLIYDRSWYGRVLVERVEGFATPAEWSRAYREINNFEAQLVDEGVVLIKFWLHLSAEEQLNRFHEREKIPYKQHKITDEDWRNRDKWNEYEMAVNEMVYRTGTEYAPWTLVAAEDKYAARIEVMETVIARLEQALAKKRAAASHS